MRQCSACNTEAELELHSSLLQLGSFTDWLQQHAGLVRSIAITSTDLPCDTGTIHGLQEEAHYMTVFRLLRQVLQLCQACLQPQHTQQQQRQHSQQTCRDPSSCSSSRARGWRASAATVWAIQAC